MSEVKVGFFTLAALLAFIYMSFKITSNQSGFGEHITYRAITKNASNLFNKTPVTFSGINVGRITNIQLSNGSALLTLEVLKEVIVTEDSTLTIRSLGFLGDKYLDLNIKHALGKENKRLKKLSLISMEEEAGMDILVKDVSTILKDVKLVTGSIREMFETRRGEEPFFKKTLRNIQHAVDNIDDVTTSFKELFLANKKSIDSLVLNLEEATHNVLDQTDPNKRDSAMSEVKEILSHLKGMAKDLNELVANVREGKGTVGKLLVEEGIVDEVQQTLSGVKKLVGRVDQIKTELEIYVGGSTERGALTSAGLYIFSAPERFYLLGLQTSEFGPELERHTSRTIEGVTVNEIYREKEKNSYLFNMQLGRKIQNWTFRGGLFESSGGIGVDYVWSNWKTKFSFDMFDYQENFGTRLRLASEFQLYSVFKSKISFEMTSEELEPDTVFSLGLRFDDEDLKGLLGLFL